MISIHNLSKSYNKGQVKAVNNLNLTVPPGEIFGFLGPNGAGKTTTIKLIVGILKPDQGTVVLAGRDNQREALACKAMTAFVPDNPDVYEKLSGLEYLNFIGDVYGVSRADRFERSQYWLDIFELGGAVRNAIQSYSHGMRQKIVLTAALMTRPRILILDEPMVGLDPKSARHLKDALRAHCDQGGTLFFSTHIMEVAEKLCDRIGIIHRGRLVACGTMAELRQQNEREKSLEDIFLELTEK
jgi:ABC-2 type transport system ATP-binding protein